MKKYVSERIVNIADLEQKLQKAHTGTLSVLEELKKDNPSISNIKGLLEENAKILTESINFEFEIERRITTDVCEQDKGTTSHLSYPNPTQLSKKVSHSATHNFEGQTDQEHLEVKVYLPQKDTCTSHKN